MLNIDRGNFDEIGVCLQNNYFAGTLLILAMCKMRESDDKGGLGGLLVFVEGPQRDRFPLRHIVLRPTTIDLGKCNASGTIDCIGQPDIAMKKIG